MGKKWSDWIEIKTGKEKGWLKMQIPEEILIVTPSGNITVLPRGEYEVAVVTHNGEPVGSFRAIDSSSPSVES